MIQSMADTEFVTAQEADAAPLCIWGMVGGARDSIILVRIV